MGSSTGSWVLWPCFIYWPKSCQAVHGLRRGIYNTKPMLGDAWGARTARRTTRAAYMLYRQLSAVSLFGRSCFCLYVGIGQGQTASPCLLEEGCCLGYGGCWVLALPSPHACLWLPASTRLLGWGSLHEDRLLSLLLSWSRLDHIHGLLTRQ